MTYHFQAIQEAAWVAAVAAATFLLQVLVVFSPDEIDDWQIWATTAGAGIVRAIAAALIAWRASSGTFTTK